MNRSHSSLPVVLAVLLLSGAGARAADQALDDAFRYLKTYDWGQERKGLAAIDRAINASAGKKETRGELEERLLGVLRSPAPRAARVYCCRKLCLIGTSRSVPVLAGLLTDRDLSHMARYALERMPEPAAGKALRDALVKVDGKIQVGVINSLGAREDREAVGSLVGLLKNEDVEIAGAAAAALGRAGTPEAADALAKFLEKAPEALRGVAGDALLDAAQRLLQQGKADLAVKLYREIENRCKLQYIRLAALRGYLQVAERKGTDPNIIEEACAGAVRLAPGVANKDRELARDAMLRVIARTGNGKTRENAEIILQDLKNKSS